MNSAYPTLLALLLVACAGPAAGPEAAPGDGLVEVVAGDAHEGPPRFAAPAGWTEEPPANAMRLVQFQVPGDPALVCIVSAWPNGVGPLEANLDRWAGQVGLDSAANLKAPARTQRDVRGYSVTTIQVEGPLAAGMSGGEALDHGAVLAAYVQAPDGPAAWTVKLQGPADQITANRPAFDALLSGL